MDMLYGYLKRKKLFFNILVQVCASFFLIIFNLTYLNWKIIEDNYNI